MYFSGHGKLDQMRSPAPVHAGHRDHGPALDGGQQRPDQRVRRRLAGSQRRHHPRLLLRRRLPRRRSGRRGRRTGSVRPVQLPRDAARQRRRPSTTAPASSPSTSSTACSRPPTHDEDGYVASPTSTPTSTGGCGRQASRSRRGGSTATGICAWRSARGPSPPRRCRSRSRRRTEPQPVGDSGRGVRRTGAGRSGPAGWSRYDHRQGPVPPRPAGRVPVDATPCPRPPRDGRRRRCGAAALLIPGSAGNHSTAGTGAYTATAPWRLRVDGTAYGNGCTVTLTNETTGEPFTLPGELYSVARFQVPSAGTFRWQANDSRCLVTPFAGSGTARCRCCRRQRRHRRDHGAGASLRSTSRTTAAATAGSSSPTRPTGRRSTSSSGSRERRRTSSSIRPAGRPSTSGRQLRHPRLRRPGLTRSPGVGCGNVPSMLWRIP